MTKQDDENISQKESVEEILAELNELLNRMPAILADIRIPDSPPPDFSAGNVRPPKPSEKTGPAVGEPVPGRAGFPGQGQPSESPAVEEIELEGAMELPVETPAAHVPETSVPEFIPHAEPVIEPVSGAGPEAPVEIIAVEESPAAGGEAQPAQFPPEPVLETSGETPAGGAVPEQLPEPGAAPSTAAGPEVSLFPEPAQQQVSGPELLASQAAGQEIKPARETQQPAPALLPEIERFPSEICQEKPQAETVSPPEGDKTLIIPVQPPSEEDKTLIITPALEVENPPEFSGDKTVVVSPEEEKTVVLSPAITARTSPSGPAAGREVFDKAVPEGLPGDQVKAMGFIYSAGGESVCAGFIAMLDDICGKSRKRPMFIQRAFVREFEEGMSGAAVLDEVTAKAAIGVVCLGDIPEPAVRDMDKMLMGSGLLFKCIGGDEACERASAVDFISEIMLR